MIPTTLVQREQHNAATFTFWLKPEQRLDYTAGQFIEMYIPHDADDRGTHRWFTISSSPSETHIAITTRKVPGMSTFKQQLFDVKPGNTLLISQAMGDFVLPMQRSVPLIFIVRGIGVTPLRSMAKQLLDDNSKERDISVIHSVKNTDDLLFQDIYQEITPDVFEQITSFENSVEKAVIQAKNIYDKKSAASIYISGPEQFAETVFSQLALTGIPANALITDYFHGYNAS